MESPVNVLQRFSTKLGAIFPSGAFEIGPSSVGLTSDIERLDPIRCHRQDPIANSYRLLVFPLGIQVIPLLRSCEKEEQPSSREKQVFFRKRRICKQCECISRSLVTLQGIFSKLSLNLSEQ
jgi:hypothetical protein